MSGAAPLAGVKVLELARLIPGALVARRLVDLGADVVKVEAPGRGDDLRAVPPLGRHGESLVQLLLERGKRSVTLAVDEERDREQVRALADVADVIIDSGSAAHHGVDVVALRQERPELVVCSVSAFGSSGAWQRLLTHGLNMDSMAGMLPVVEKAPGRWEVADGFLVNPSMEIAAAGAASAVVAALLRVARGGEGAALEAATWDAGAVASRLPIAHQAVWGEPMPALNRLGFRYGVYECSDGGLVLLGALEPKFWARFCEGIGRPDLLDASRSGEAMDFSEDDTARAELAAVFRTAPRDVWLQRLIDWKVAGSAVLRPEELLGAPHLADRRIVAAVGEGEVPVFRDPVLWDGAALHVGDEPRPVAPGHHTVEVLEQWLGAPVPVGPADPSPGAP